MQQSLSLVVLRELCVSVVNPLRSRTLLFLTVGIAAVAYVAAALGLVVLTWDGAGYVFNSIQRGHPAIPNSRYSDYPFLAVISLLSLVINDARWLAGIYGLVLAVMPLGSLLLCFYFLRGPLLRPLRIWGVLGILLSVLPGQAFLVAEAVQLVQVSWAIWAIAAADITGASLIWLAVLNLFLFFLHPTAAVTYAVTSGLFLGKAWTANRQRGSAVWLGLVFLGLAAIRLWYALATANSYERGEESFAENYQVFRDALPSLRMLPLVYLLGIVALTGVTRRLSSRRAIWLGGLMFGLLIGYGLFWAADPRAWASAFSFRRFVLVGALPLVGLGALHWWYQNREGDTHRSDDSPAAFIMLGSAVVFLLVFGTQAFTWSEELSRFQAALAHSEKPVATVDDLPWIPGSPLYHWASTPLSCVIQGKQVKTLFALHASDVSGSKVLLFPGAWFRPRNRWFEFERKNE